VRVSGIVWLDALARDVLAEEAAKRRLLETGGPIFGYESEGDVVVAKLYGPGRSARHRRASFSCAIEWIAACIEETFSESDGRWWYLGEWHTHPLGRPTPSRQDVQAVARIAEAADVELPRPTILIQGTKLFRRRVHMDRLAAYQWNADQAKLIERPIRLASPAE
jgi:integrative and conjugative element protein (TIGR02256 family)